MCEHIERKENNDRIIGDFADKAGYMNLRKNDPLMHEPLSKLATFSGRMELIEKGCNWARGKYTSPTNTTQHYAICRYYAKLFGEIGRGRSIDSDLAEKAIEMSRFWEYGAEDAGGFWLH